MKQQHTAWTLILFASGLSGSLFFTACARKTASGPNIQREAPRLNKSLSVVPQKMSARSFSSWPARLAWKTTAPDLVPSVLVQVHASPDGSAVYGLDRQSGCIVKMSQAANEGICLKDTESRLPLAANNFELDEDGQSFVVSAMQHHLYRRDAAGNVKRLRDSTDVGYFAIDRSRLVYLNSTAPDHGTSFRWLDLKDTNGTPHQSEVPSIFEDEKRHRFALLGKLTAERSSHMLYHVSDRTSVLLGIANSDNKVALAFARQTIDHTPMPTLELFTVRGADVSRYAFGQPLVAAGVTADSGRVWILSLLPSGKKTYKSVLDAYDAQNGDYLFSYKLPSEPLAVSVRGNRFYFSVDQGVEVWEDATSARAWQPTASRPGGGN